MSTFSDVSPIIIKKRQGTSGEPYKPITENLNIEYNVGILNEIPDNFKRVKIEGMHEKRTDYYNTDSKIEENEYIVDYKLGFIYFNEKMNKKTVQVSYLGTGIVLYPASRIYDTGKKDIIITIQEMIDGGRKAIEVYSSIDKAIEVAKGYYAKITTTTQLAKEQDTALNITIIKGNEINNILKENINKATDINNTLNGSVENGENKITEITKKQNEIDQNEEIRIKNEKERLSNEVDRELNENDRVKNEQIRKDNEVIRQQNETNREDNFNKLKKQTEKNIEIQNNNNTIQEDKIKEIASTNTKMLLQEKTIENNEKIRKQNFNNVKSIIDDFLINVEEFNNEKKYKKYNRVVFKGSCYECIKDCNGEIPTSQEYWICIAKRGQDGIGSGDMHTNIYDKNKDGIVDMAESVPWDGIIGKPNLDDLMTSVQSFKHTEVLKEQSNEVNIGISEFNKLNDKLFIFQNSSYIEQDEDYKISEDGLKIIRIKDVPWNEGTVFNFVLLKSSKNKTQYKDGALIQDESITINKLNKDIQDKIKNIDTSKVELLELIDAREGEKTLKENLDKNYLKKKDAMFNEIEDANNATETGFYSVHSSAQNLPQKLLFLPSRVFMLVGNYEGDITQMAFTEEYIYTRTYRQNTWTTWLNYLTGDSSQLPLPENEFPKGDVVENIKAIYERVKKLEADSGHGGVEVTKVTYEELKDLVKQKQLIPGGIYVLTDYQTKYKQPDTDKIITCEHVEDLILTANDVDSLRTVCYSTKYPQDIIHYDIDNIWADKETPRPGFIVYRHDTINNNKCSYDFRNMLWARWCPDEKQYYKDDKLVDYEVWTEGAVKFDVLYKADNQLLLAKESGTPESATDGNYFTPVYSNTEIGCLIEEKTKTFNKSICIKKGELQERLTFGTNCTNNTFRGKCINNVLGDNCSNNTFGCNCHSNTFGTKCARNILGNNCTSNFFEEYCSTNIFNNSCSRNIIGISSDYNYFGNNCEDNIFGYACNANTFGNRCSANRFSNYCTHNTFENDCYNNSFDTSCDNNYFQNNCDHNIFKGNCCNNAFGNDCDGNEFSKNCYANIFGNGCTNNIFYVSCRGNYFGASCNLNNFGGYCDYNTFNNNCYSNTFSDAVKNIIVECLRNRNLTSISDIVDKDFTITITKGKDSNYYYHFYNGSSEEYHRIP